MQPLFLFLSLKHFFMKNLSIILLAFFGLTIMSCEIFNKTDGELEEDGVAGQYPECADTLTADSSDALTVDLPADTTVDSVAVAAE